MRRAWFWACFYLAFLLTAFPAQSQPVVKLEANVKQFKLEGFMARAENVSPQATVAEMASSSRPVDFVPMSHDVSGGYSNLDHWYRFTVVRLPGASSHWLLVLGSQVLNEIYIYEPDQSGGFVEHRLGDHGEKTSQHVVSRQHALRLNFRQYDEPSTFYIRIRSNSVLSFAAAFWQPDALFVEEGRVSFFLGIILGVFAIIVVVYGLFGVWLKDQLFIGFALYVASLFTSYFGINGFTELIFDNEPMLLNDLLVGVGTVSTCAFLLFLLDRLLDLKNILPKIHNLYIGSMAIMLIGAFFVTTEYYGYFARLSFFLVVPAVGVGLIVLTMIMIREGIKPFLAVCYLAFLVALIVGTLRISLILGGAPRSILSDANYQIAFLFHVLLLALGFAIRILEIERDRSQAHEEARLSAIDAEEQRQFVGMLSHEFRAPLEDIEKAALAVEASDAFFPDKVKERLGRIRGQSQQLAAMVNSFLVAEAFKHGILALKKDNISLETLLCGIVERYAELIPPWRLSYRVTPPGLQAELDGEMIEIAIGNLVANALRYSSPETSVRVSAAAAAGALLISVNDQGAGMSKEEVSHMGEMYFRAQSSKGTKGTGLGLHMTKMIITAHGGSWQIDSQIGKGTRIAIRLPQNKTGATA